MKWIANCKLAPNIWRPIHTYILSFQICYILYNFFPFVVMFRLFVVLNANDKMGSHFLVGSLWTKQHCLKLIIKDEFWACVILWLAKSSNISNFNSCKGSPVYCLQKWLQLSWHKHCHKWKKKVVFSLIWDAMYFY